MLATFLSTHSDNHIQNQNHTPWQLAPLTPAATARHTAQRRTHGSFPLHSAKSAERSALQLC
jgi:hypothetical protein